MNALPSVMVLACMIALGAIIAQGQTTRPTITIESSTAEGVFPGGERTTAKVGILDGNFVLGGGSLRGSPTTRQTMNIDGAGATLPRGALLHVSFTEADPSSSLEAQNRRYNLRIEPEQRYSLPDESFELYVPPSAADHACGIFIWINAGDIGQPLGGWPMLLEQHHLIWVGANHSGNPRGIAVRIGLALDAVHNLKKIFKIDDSRIYVSGLSGGAKVASIVAMIYPEVFQGAIPIVGVTYFRGIPVTGRADTAWESFFNPPRTAQAFDRARREVRFVLITGSEDFNRESIHDTYENGFVKDGFRYVQYVEVPGMGHTRPDLKWISQAIDTLDAPLAKRAVAGTTAPTTRPAGQPVQASSPETEAQTLLSLADSYEANGRYAEARQRLQKILSDYPGTKAAPKARAALERIKAK